MLRANQIAQPCYCFSRTKEVSEFSFAIKRGGIPNDMVMNVSLVCMSAYDEGVFAFEKAGCEIITDLICFFRRDFAGFERLANLICDHIVYFVFPCKILVLPFCKSKLRINSSIVAGIARNQFAIISLIQIQSILCSI